MAEAALRPVPAASPLSLAYQQALAVAAVVVFYSGVTVWSFNAGVSPLAPNRWLALFAAMALPLMGPTHVVALMRSRLTWWIAAYLAMTSLWFTFGDVTDAGVTQAGYRLFATSFLFVALLVFGDSRTHVPARRAIVGCVVANVAFNLYDLTHPMVFSRDIGRAAGLYVNANISGAALALGMILGFGVLRGAARHAYVILAGIGVATTQSRSAALTYVIAVVVLSVGRELRPMRLVATLLGAAAVGAAVLWATGQLGPLTELVSSGQLGTFSRLTSASGAANEGDFYSTQSRIDVARNAWQTFTQHPVIGGGLGASGYTHNMYLMHVADHGILGLFIFPAFVLSAMLPFRGRDRRMLAAAAVSMLVWGLFSHNVLEEMHTLLAAALAASLARTPADDADDGARAETAS